MGASRGRLWLPPERHETQCCCSAPGVGTLALPATPFHRCRGWNTLAGYLLFALVYSLFSDAVPYPLLALLTHMIAISQAFVCHRYLLYRTSNHWLKDFLRFHLAHLGLFVLSLAGLTALVEWGGLHPLLAQAAMTIAAVISSYFVHTFFTFRTARL